MTSGGLTLVLAGTGLAGGQPLAVLLAFYNFDDTYL